jgi:hypothetical protein
LLKIIISFRVPLKKLLAVAPWAPIRVFPPDTVKLEPLVEPGTPALKKFAPLEEYEHSPIYLYGVGPEVVSDAGMRF